MPTTRMAARRFLERALICHRSALKLAIFRVLLITCVRRPFIYPGSLSPGSVQTLPVACLAQPNRKGRWRNLASCGPPIFDVFAVIYSTPTKRRVLKVRLVRSVAADVRVSTCSCVRDVVRSSTSQRLSPSTMFSTPVCYSDNQCEIS